MPRQLLEIGMSDLNEAVVRLERAYTAGMDEEYRDDLRTVLDALSAQPDAGSGGDARAQFEAWAKGQGYSVEWKHEGYVQRSSQIAYHAWQAAIAARQPVGVEPFAWYYYSHNPMLTDPALAFTTSIKTARAMNGCALYTAPPAPAAARQAVGEPVAVVSQETYNDNGTSDIIKPALPIGTPLYTVPPAPAAVPMDAPYSLDADPAGIRSRVADCIAGTMMVGAQDHTPPPADHWLEPFWNMARADAAVPEGWVLAPVEATDQMAEQGDLALLISKRHAKEVWSAMLAAKPEVQ